MGTKMAMWGNSLAVRIPKELCSALNLTENTPVVLERTDTGLILRPENPNEAKVRSLMDGITPDKYYGKLDWDKSDSSATW